MADDHFILRMKDSEQRVMVVVIMIFSSQLLTSQNSLLRWPMPMYKVQQAVQEQL